MPLPLQPPVSVPVGPTGRSFYVEEPTNRSDSSIEFDAFDAVQAGMGAKRPRQFFPWKGSVPGVIQKPSIMEKLNDFGVRMQADGLTPGRMLKDAIIPDMSLTELQLPSILGNSGTTLDNAALALSNAKQAFFPKKTIEPTTFDLLPDAVHEEMANQKGIPLGSIVRHGLEQTTPIGNIANMIEGFEAKSFGVDEYGRPVAFGVSPEAKEVAATVRAFERPVMNQAEDLGNFLGTPVGMAAALAAKTPIGRIVSGLFSADLASGAPELIRQKRETLANPKATLEEKVDAVLSDTLNKVMIVGTAGHAFKGKGAPVNTERGLMRREQEILEPEIVGPEAGPGQKPVMAIEKYKEPSDTVLDVVSEKGPTIESAEGIRNLYEQKRPEIEGIAKNEKVIKALEKELTAKVEKIWSLPENQGMGKPSPESIRKMAEDAFRQGPPDVRRDMTDWVRERAEKEGREIVEKQQEIPSSLEAQGREAVRYQELRNKVIKENAAALSKIKNPADLQVAITELARKEQEKITAPTPEEIQARQDKIAIDQAIAEQVIGEKVPARPFNKPNVTPFEPPVIPKESFIELPKSSVPKKTLPLGPQEKLPGFDPAKDIDFKAIEGGPEKTVPTPAEPLFKEPTPTERAKITGSELPRNIRERGTKLYTGGEIAFAIDKFKDMIRNGRAYPIRLGEKARERYNLGEAVVDAKTGEVFHPGDESIKLDLLPEDKIPWYDGERTKSLFDGVREAADKGFENRPKIQQESPLPESGGGGSAKLQGDQSTGSEGNLFSNPLADPEQLKKMVKLNVVGKHDKDTWFGTLQARLAPDEMTIYKEAGLEKFLEGEKRSVEEVRDWMEANSNTALEQEVKDTVKRQPKTYVMVKGEGMSPERVYKTALEHLRSGDKTSEEATYNYLQLEELVQGKEVPQDVKATAQKLLDAYNKNNAPQNVQRVDVVMPLKSSADLREDLIFRNPDGSPKTDVTGKLFDISDISPDHKWTQFRRDKAGSQPQEGRLYSNPFFDPEFLKQVFGKSLKGKTYKDFLKERVSNRGFPGFKSMTDKIWNKTKDIEGGPEVHRGINYKIAQQKMILGEWINKVQNAILGPDTLGNSLKRWTTFIRDAKTRNEVGLYLLQKRDGMNPAKLSPEKQRIADAMTDVFFDSQTEAKRQGVLNIAGEELSQYPKEKGYYPNTIMKEGFENVLRKGNPVPEFNRIKKSIIKHWRSKDPRLTEAKAEKEFADWLQVKRSPAGSFDWSSDFNALRKFSGRGLPHELVDTDVLRVAGKYYHRYAKDLAHHKMKAEVPGIDYVLGEVRETTPELAKKYGPLKEQAGDIYNDWLEHEYNPKGGWGRDSSLAWNRFAANVALGPFSAIRDVAQLPTEIAKIVGVRDLPLVLKAVKQIKEGRKLAEATGARQRTLMNLDVAESNPAELGTKTKRVLDSLSLLKRKLGLRDWKDKTEADLLASLANLIIEGELGKARRGEKEAILNIQNISDGLTGGSEKLLKSKEPLTHEQKLELIHGFVESVRGKYDPRSLPKYATDSWLSPFLSLARWNIGKTNQFRTELLNPAAKGNYKPLLRYVLAGLGVSSVVITSLNEILNRKRRESPTIEEAFKEGQTGEQATAILDNLAIAGVGGLVPSMGGAAIEAATGDMDSALKRIPFGAPGLTMIQELFDSFEDIADTYKEKGDIIEGITQVGANLSTTLLQEARFIDRNLLRPELAEEKSTSRDVRTWKGLRDSVGSDTPEFKDTPLPDERAKYIVNEFAPESLPDFEKMEKAFYDYADSLYETRLKERPEKILSKLEALKSRKPYPNLPDIKTFPGEADTEDFLSFIRKTQGDEAAKDIQDKINKNQDREEFKKMVDYFTKNWFDHKFGERPKYYRQETP